MLGMLLKMDKRPCELDQSLVKAAVMVRAPQPKMFEDIVRFVVLCAVEAKEIGAVFSGEKYVCRLSAGFPRSQPILESIVFFHSHHALGDFSLRELKQQQTTSVKSDSRNPLIESVEELRWFVARLRGRCWRPI